MLKSLIKILDLFWTVLNVINFYIVAFFVLSVLLEIYLYESPSVMKVLNDLLISLALSHHNCIVVCISSFIVLS